MNAEVTLSYYDVLIACREYVRKQLNVPEDAGVDGHMIRLDTGKMTPWDDNAGARVTVRYK